MQHPESPWRNMSRWILAVLVVLPCSTIWAQQDEPQISIKNRVALALKGQDVRFEFTLIVPVNQSGTMDCFNPEGKTLPVTDPQLTVNAQTATRRTRTVMIRDCSESDSGEYRCAFKKAEVYWSLLVREKGYEEPFSISNYVGIVAVGALSFGLLLFSVAGSVYVFTGNGNNATMETKSNNGSGQSEEKKKDEGDGHKSMKEAAPDSVYQSLENRNKSIYEELDHSASAGPQSDQKKVKRKSKKAKKTTVPTTEVRESVECVYENF